MAYYKRSPFWLSLFSASVMIVAFQNCGPAQLVGSATEASQSPNENVQEGDPAPPPSGPTTGQPPSPTPVPTTPVHIQSRLNTAAFFSMGSSNDGTALTLWDRVVSVGQDYVFSAAGELRVVGKCLNVPGNLGQYILLGDCLGTANQKWTYHTATNTIRSGNGYCIEVLNGNTNAGAPLVLNTCTGQVPQQWNLQP